MKSTCTKCGTGIKNVYTINGKAYGSTCAARVLGLIDLPEWYQGGEYEAAKKKHEDRVAEFVAIKELTAKHWPTFVELSKAQMKARYNSSNWEIKFVDSIIRQLGFRVSFMLNSSCFFKTYEEASEKWNSDFMGSFPYLLLNKTYKSIESLSDKQRSIFNRILNS